MSEGMNDDMNVEMNDEQCCVQCYERFYERWWERDEWSSGPGKLRMIEKRKDENGLCVKQTIEQFWFVRQVG